MVFQPTEAGGERNFGWWMDHMSDKVWRLDLHWIAARCPLNDSKAQIRHASRTAAFPRAGVRHWCVDNLLQPAASGRHGEDLRRACRAGDVRGGGDAGRLRTGIAALRSPG